MKDYFKSLLVLFKSLIRLVCVYCKYRCLNLGNAVLSKSTKIQSLINADKNPQSKKSSTADNFLNAIQALRDIPVEYIRRSIEITEAGKTAIATNPNRRLYAVLDRKSVV